MRTSCWLIAVCLGIALSGVVFGPAWAKEGTYDPIIDPADFVGGIDNPYMPLMPGTIFVYEGETEDGIETNEVYVTHQTKEILGVTCIVVWDRVWLDGELIEETYDWYAQDKDGNDWYFGEDSKEYEGGVVVSTEGSWEAGVDGAEPGIVMKANPQVGDSYRQEYYEGEAEDMAEVLSLTESVSVGYGDFDNCLMTKEWTALDPGVVEHKYFAAGVGEVLVVMVEGGSDRAELKDKRYDPIIDPADFAGGIDNPYMPLMPGTIFVYEGETEDGTETNEVYVTHQTKEILGVTCTVVWDRVWLDGELIEETYDWYAQDKDGNVWYFGEDSKEYEGGVVVSTEGSWEAGVDGAEPGIVMEARPKIGDSYRQEYYEGEAEDMAEVLSLTESVSVAYGDFDNCLMTKDWTALNPGVVEHKYFAAGVGEVLVVMVEGGSDRAELKEIRKDFAVDKMSGPADSPVIEWNSEDGANYQVWVSADLGDWQTGSGVLSASGTGANSWTDDGQHSLGPPSQAQRRFYRVERLP